jgi:hypothetical protein
MREVTEQELARLHRWSAARIEAAIAAFEAPGPKPCSSRFGCPPCPFPKTCIRLAIGEKCELGTWWEKMVFIQEAERILAARAGGAA